MMRKFILLVALCVLGLQNLSAQYTKLNEFITDNDLSSPYYTQPVYDGTYLYAMTQSGGANTAGCIFKIKPDGSGYMKLHDFDGTHGSSPMGSLLLSNNGLTLYGMTNSGGANSAGVIFSIQIDGGNFKDIFDFDPTNKGAANPQGSLTLYNGLLYGMTTAGGLHDIGTIFSFDPANPGAIIDLWDFSGTTTDGSQPFSSLILSGTLLYGMTPSGGLNDDGTIFSFKPADNTLIILHSFDHTVATDGAAPNGSLTLSGDGTVLYGTTFSGGVNNIGTVFSINTDGSNFGLLHSFDNTVLTNGYSPKSTLTLINGVLFGMSSQGGDSNTDGTIFSIKTDGSNFSDIFNFNGTNGSQPNGSLTMIDGTTLCGMTLSGASGKGCMFKIDATGNNFGLLVNCSAATNGSYPVGVVTDGTWLYGVTTLGGIAGNGCIYKEKPDGSSYTKLYDFNATNGYNPFGNLIINGSVLYGMTSIDGSNLAGTIFKINTDGSSYADIHVFGGTLLDATADGATPKGALTISNDGNTLYGMTSAGGDMGFGTIFTINVNGTGYTKLYSFAGTPDGATPNGSLTLTANGNTLYGMTSVGGINGGGSIFSYDLGSSSYHKLYDFNATDYPQGTLTLNDGLLYGMTNTGGANSVGSIFSFDPTSPTTINIYSFGSYTNDGTKPYGALTINGSTLFGMTYTGGLNNLSSGTIFQVNTDGTGYKELHAFGGTLSGNSTDGSSPSGSLITIGNTLYGTTNEGGTNGNGVVFSYSLFTITYNANGGTGAPTDANLYSPNDNVTVLGASILNNCTFKNWNTFANGSGSSYAVSGSLIMLASNVTLYAQYTVTISGNTVIDGVSLTDGTQTVVSSGGGNYTFTENYNWSGTIIPTLAGYTFTPPSQTFTNVINNQTQNFTANIVTSNTTTWNSSLNYSYNTAHWNNGVPTASSNVIVHSGEVIFDADLTIASMVINPGANVTIASGKTLIITGNFTLQSDVTGSGSIIDYGTLTINGSNDIQRYIPSGNQWHYIGSPNPSTTSAVVTGNYLKWFNEQASNVSNDNFFTGCWQTITSTTMPLTPMEGFAFWTYGSNATLHFNGSLNTGAQSITATNSGLNAGDGFNLIANPYPSAIDWDQVNPAIGSVYYWDGHNYQSYNKNTGGTGSQIVPISQGMFVNYAGLITFDNSVRVHPTSQAFYKSTKALQNILSLSISGNNYNDVTFIHFDANATPEFDQVYDAYKMFGIVAAPQLYTLTGSGTKLSINTTNGIQNGTSLTIPLGVSVGVAGTYTFTVPQLNFDDIYSIYLTDNTTNATVDLRATPNYKFTLSAGTDQYRFKIVIDKSPTSVNQIQADNSIHITNFNNNVKIAINESKASVYVYSISGAEIMHKDFASQQFNFMLPYISACYIVKVVTSTKCVSKLIIN